MKTLPKLWSFLVMAFLISSGASTWASDAAALRSIHTVTISRDVKMPKRMKFFGLGEMIGMTAAASTGGAAGASLAAEGSSHRKAPYDFGVPEALRTEFTDAFNKSGKFSVKKQGPADAELRFEVEEYGFESAEMFSRRVNPALTVRAKLVRPDGSVVWKFKNVVSHMTDDTPAVFPKEIRENPQIGVHALRVAARLSAAKAVEKYDD